MPRHLATRRALLPIFLVRSPGRGVFWLHWSWAPVMAQRVRVALSVPLMCWPSGRVLSSATTLVNVQKRRPAPVPSDYRELYGESTAHLGALVPHLAAQAEPTCLLGASAASLNEECD